HYEGEDKFDSELMKLQIGYGPTPQECRSGGTLTKRDDQVWLSATCDCPRNEDTPTSVRDCRLTDQESDRAPGATFPATIDTQAIRYHAAQEERLQFLRGFRLDGRLYADRLFEDTTRVLDCTVNDVQTSSARCPQGVPKPCPSKYNKVELFKPTGNYDCERVIAEEHALFRSPQSAFPDACPAELSGALNP
ncbi:MAG TPA: hypothetical protein VMF89_31760, partial [Polyangiales bacterium]|nr:hypothetical protein [Polyangiales bacterium]